MRDVNGTVLESPYGESHEYSVRVRLLDDRLNLKVNFFNSLNRNITLADSGLRQNTNIFRVPPGGGALVKTGGMPINQAIMPLPYQPPSQALMSLVNDMAQTGMRIGGTSEQQVGEGRAEAPVGTTLAMIEQAVKVMNAVHKRMHAAQAEELEHGLRVAHRHRSPKYMISPAFGKMRPERQS